MTTAVYGFAASIADASRIADDLRAAGFPAEDISVLFPRDAYAEGLVFEKSSKAPEGVAAGAGTGGLVGGTLGWLVGIGMLAIPGLGPFVAAGPIMAALGGAAVGATVGGLSGGLIGLGIPQLEAHEIERKIRDGEILVAVRTHNGDERDQASAILAEDGAADVACAPDGRVVEVGEERS